MAERGWIGRRDLVPPNCEKCGLPMARLEDKELVASFPGGRVAFSDQSVRRFKAGSETIGSN